MSETVIRVSRGVGSSPKLWAVATGKVGARRWSTQVGELDLAEPRPGYFDAEANGWQGMTGMVWAEYDRVGGVWCWPAGTTWPTALGLTERVPFASADAWVAEIARLWLNAEIVRADDEPQNWL